ncbi:hypothetical protein GCM10008014_25230 [Paenibacillus silvae]|uniref:Uncharacterized protein n=1 Tax=Paenibacillus silvae TaxID=1325358 RepID=A0ABQ1ZDA5_9BACL|nr:hypothetical protein GCM10008014_25230 [Paenibacillus silvae]
MPAPFENQAPLFYVARETVICAFDLQERTWGVYQSIYMKIGACVGYGFNMHSYVIGCWKKKVVIFGSQREERVS